jgi:glycerol-3-phosphate acyltransferase PlsX
MRIALDAMGGDFAPGPIVAGAVDAVNANETLEIVLVGDREKILACLNGQEHPRLEIVHTTQVVGMEEKPSVLRTKRDSSIVRCWELMANNTVEAIVSAGNTGAMAAGGLFTRLFLKGVKRPGIAVVVPSLRGPVVLLDVGANAAPKGEHLFQYGVMGAVYAKAMLGVANPKIGLMNIGTEDGKGNELAKETYDLFVASHLKDQFHGNVEGRDLYQGTVNVFITDGFVGNVVLKVSEGILDMLMKHVARDVLGALDTEKHKAEHAIRTLGASYHHSSFGGAPLLGVDGVCIICHGSSNEKAIRNALLRAAQHGEARVNELIAAELERAPSSPTEGASGAPPAAVAASP